MSAALVHKIPIKHQLNDLADVLIATPANNEVLTYEVATAKWKNKVVAGGSAWKLMKAALVATNQIIPTSAWTKCTLSVELVDDDSAFDPATYRFVVPVTGRYLVIAGAMFSDLTDQTDFELMLINQARTVSYLFTMTRMSGAGWIALQSLNIVTFTAGEDIHLEVYQASGANRTLRGDQPTWTFLTIYRVLP